jgi:hypothetical protein
MELTPFVHEMASPSQQTLLSFTQPSPRPITPTPDDMPSSKAFFDFMDSPVVTPPLSPLSSSPSYSSKPSSAHLQSQTPTTQCNRPADDDLDALFAKLILNTPPLAEGTNLTTAFTQPDQVGLRSLLDSILTSPWLIKNDPEPKDEKNRSILLEFLAHETTGGTYRCLFDGCHKSMDRQDRSLGHIRMHVGHRPFGCNGLCGVPDCQERFYCQSYLRSHAKRQKAPCDIWYVGYIFCSDRN